jgi:hypothetical protein
MFVKDIADSIIQAMTEDASLKGPRAVIALNTVEALGGQYCFVRASDVLMIGDEAHVENLAHFVGLRLSRHGFEIGLISTILRPSSHRDVPTLGFELGAESYAEAARIIVEFLHDDKVPETPTLH